LLTFILVVSCEALLFKLLIAMMCAKCKYFHLILKTARGILRISKVSHAFIYKGHQVKGHIVELTFTNKLMHLNL
jgi:hypothetical protein